MRSTRRASSFLLSLGTLASLFLAGEAILRWRHARFLERLSTRELCTRAADDPELHYTYIPGKCGANSRGYLDDEHSLEKPEDVTRLVVIGDSVAAGAGVGYRQSFGKVLEGLLRGRGPGHPEVILLARTGYSTSQELVLLDGEALAYDPDVLIWSYVLNDPAHPVYHDANGELGRYHHRPRSHLAHFVTGRLYRVRERALVALGCRNEYHARLHCAYWGRVEAAFRRLGRVSKERRLPVVVMIHPVFERERSFEEYSLTGLHEQLRELAESEGLWVLDLLDAYGGYHASELKKEDEGRWYDPWHPNEKGHAVAAEALLRLLLSRDFRSTTPRLPPARSPR